MGDLAAKVPEDLWPEFKARATAAAQAPSRAIARDLAEGAVAAFETELPSAVACFQDDTRVKPKYKLSWPASRSCACRTRTAEQRGPQIASNGYSSRSAGA